MLVCIWDSVVVCGQSSEHVQTCQQWDKLLLLYMHISLQLPTREKFLPQFPLILLFWDQSLLRLLLNISMQLSVFLYANNVGPDNYVII